jgi:hypothetical protein
MATPLDMGRVLNARAAAERLAAQRERRRIARRNGYTGPLTRAELAARVRP